MPPNEPGFTPFRVLIVDDEEPGRINLRYMLAVYPHWTVVAECASVQEARNCLAAESVDVVFLDIQMPGESGLGLARTLCTSVEPPLVIFVTAYNAYAIEAFEVHAVDYLLKPFNDQRLGHALERAKQLLELHQRGPYSQTLRDYLHEQEQSNTGHAVDFLQQLTVRSVGKIEWIPLQDVLWISAASNYVELHTASRTILHRLPLSRLEERLDPKVFLRVHRSSIVRIDQLHALKVVGDGSYLLTLRCGEHVAVSERFVHAVRSFCPDGLLLKPNTTDKKCR
nr:LytTR family DNA-binding domain-containing protein [uncultured Rhodoferax sp.]